MYVEGWKYYNHAAIPTTAPHETPDLTPLEDGSIWRIEGKKALFARYTTDWDCAYDTGWWYIIKDSPFDISALKTKRRYEITKANRFFDVYQINPAEHLESLREVHERALLAYPSKYRPFFNKKFFEQDVLRWERLVENGSLKIFGAFLKENGKLCGYSYLALEKNYCNLAMQKTIPEFEKFNVNAALVNGVLDSIKDRLSADYYICDGSRSINHETHFQDYLEKYFGFRKAYCKLQITYYPLYRVPVNILYHLRFLIFVLGRRIGLFHQLSAILKMEEIVRKQ